MNTLARCSESTGRANLAVGSSDWRVWDEESTEKEKTCSLAVTPCKEVPIEPSSLEAILGFESEMKDSEWVRREGLLLFLCVWCN